jgi:hypothetical protein
LPIVWEALTIDENCDHVSALIVGAAFDSADVPSALEFLIHCPSDRATRLEAANCFTLRARAFLLRAHSLHCVLRKQEPRLWL